MIKSINNGHYSNPFNVVGSNRKRRRVGRSRSIVCRAIFIFVVFLVTLNILCVRTYNTSTGQISSLYIRSSTGNYEWSSHPGESFVDPLDWSSPGKYAVWTYPLAPPSSVVIHEDEIIVCAYQSCRDFAMTTKHRFRSFNLAEIVSLADGLSREQAANFQQFLIDQYWYKIQHKMEFSHHVQSVAVLSLIAMKRIRHSDFCIRSLGYPTLLCGKDSKDTNINLRSEYDPTSNDPSKNVPPYRIDGLDFNATRFGVLSYDRRVTVVKVANSGDELQTFPGLQFLPYLTDYVDRDNGLPTSHANHLFANAWWGYPSLFPPPSEMTAAFFSVHMSGRFQTAVVSRNMAYFRQYVSHIGPIGARDLPTLAFLDSLGLPTYQSSCFTQMLRPNGNNYKETVPHRDLIMLVDVDPELLPADVAKRGQNFAAEVDKSQIYQQEARLEHAQRLYYLYSNKAKVVITSRIHSALPASVNGVPVIFVERSEANLPGGKGGRTRGISDLFHTYRPEDGDQWSFDLDNMPPNPGVHRQDRYRASFWNYMRQRLPSWYVDTAKLFGLVPLRRLGEGIDSRDEEIHDFFHLIFTTPPETLTWRVQRAIEAVFFHHPNAKVILHSNTLPVTGSRLDRFAEVGFDLEIRSYNLESLLGQSHAVSEIDRQHLLNLLDSYKKGEFWYSHETDLIRLLVIEKHGGVYIDTDLHIIKPFPKSLGNVLAYQDHLTPTRAIKFDLAKKVNGAVMIFDKDNAFLLQLVAEAVNRLLHNYNPNDWGILGPNLISEVWWAYERENSRDLHVRVLDSATFYPYNFHDAQGCFRDYHYFNPITEKTYAVHLNSKLTSDFQSTSKGSYCDLMFHTHCIFCDEIYTSPMNAALFFNY